MKMGKVFLLETVLPEITGGRLPTNGQVLRNMLYYVQVLSFTALNAIIVATDNASLFWSRAGLPMKMIHYSRSDLKDLYNHWKGLRKTSSNKREEATYKEKVKMFMSHMEKGFDMAGKYKTDDLKDKESQEFLRDQIEGERKWRMEGKDSKATKAALENEKKKERSLKRKQNEVQRQKNWEEQEKRESEIQVNLEKITI